MKIAMFSDAYFPRVNGVGVSVKCFGESLAKMGHEVCVVCPAYDLTKKVIIESTPIKGFSVMRIPAKATTFSKEDRFVKPTNWGVIKREMDKFKPDVIHINAEFTLGILGTIYARRKKIALVYTSHTMWESYIKNYAPFIPSCLAKKSGNSWFAFLRLAPRSLFLQRCG